MHRMCAAAQTPRRSASCSGTANCRQAGRQARQATDGGRGARPEPSDNGTSYRTRGYVSFPSALGACRRENAARRRREDGGRGGVRWGPWAVSPTTHKRGPCSSKCPPPSVAGTCMCDSSLAVGHRLLSFPRHSGTVLPIHRYVDSGLPRRWRGARDPPTDVPVHVGLRSRKNSLCKNENELNSLGLERHYCGEFGRELSSGLDAHDRQLSGFRNTTPTIEVVKSPRRGKPALPDERSVKPSNIFLVGWQKLCLNLVTAQLAPLTRQNKLGEFAGESPVQHASGVL